MDKKFAGLLSFIGTYVLILVVGIKAAPAGLIMAELGSFFAGGVAGIDRQPVMFLAMLPVLLLIVAVEMPISLGVGIGLQAVFGKSKHSLRDHLEEMAGKKIFKSLFVMVLLEELFARGLFLALLTKIPFLAGPAAFYVLMLIGNALWSLAHLSNFKEKAERHPVRVLPQFIGGLFLSYVFVKYGLLASTLAH